MLENPDWYTKSRKMNQTKSNLKVSDLGKNDSTMKNDDKSSLGPYAGKLIYCILSGKVCFF